MGVGLILAEIQEKSILLPNLTVYNLHHKNSNTSYTHTVLLEYKDSSSVNKHRIAVVGCPG
jgi:hypothetical protein